MEGVPNFKLRSRDPDRAHFMGQFVVHWLEHVNVHVCNKFELSIFGRSRDIKGVPKISKMVTWPEPRPYRGQIFILQQTAS